MASHIWKDELNTITEGFQTTFEKGMQNGYTPLGENGLIPYKFIPEIETKSILTPFCLNSCRLDSKGNTLRGCLNVFSFNCF